MSFRYRGALSAALSILLTVLSGCAVNYAVVREERFRSEVSRNDRVQLPLNQESTPRLLEFLKAGGDRTKMDKIEAMPNTEAVYGPLLKALQDPRMMTASTKTPRKQFCQLAAEICSQTKLFRGRRAVMDIIDARERAPVFPYPIAVSDGRYWWIFYARRDQGVDRFYELLVTRTVLRKEP